MAALRHLAIENGMSETLYIDSCGLGWHHLGEHPDRRTFEAAKKRGILIDHRAQQFQDGFLDAFDYIFAVDSDIVYQIVERARTDEQKEKIHLATAFSEKYKNQPIPDPYYMSLSGFDDVMDMVLDSAKGILEFLKDENKNHLDQKV